MADADGAPRNDGGQAGDGHEPVENSALLGEVGEEGDETKGTGDCNCNKRAAFAVDVAEDLRSLAEVCESGECTRRTKHGRVSDREDSREDDCVHD